MTMLPNCGQCGASAENPASFRCVSISKCDNNIRSRPMSFGAGFADSIVKTACSCFGRYEIIEIFGNVSMSAQDRISQSSVIVKNRGLAGGGGGGG